MKADNDSHGDPVTILIDVVIQFLEKGTTFMRSVANRAFTLLSAFLKSSSMDLIIAVSPLVHDLRSHADPPHLATG